MMYTLCIFLLFVSKTIFHQKMVFDISFLLTLKFLFMKKIWPNFFLPIFYQKYFYTNIFFTKRCFTKVFFGPTNFFAKNLFNQKINNFFIWDQFLLLCSLANWYMKLPSAYLGITCWKKVITADTSRYVGD